jgi:hypothetical protein
MRPREGQKHRPSERADVVSYVCSASRRPVCRALRRLHLSSVWGILPGGLRLRLTEASGLGSRLWCVFWRVWGGRRIQARASSPCGRPRRSDGSWIWRADGDRRLPPPQVRGMSNTCPLLLPRPRAYRYRGLDRRGVGGRERRPAAAVTEAGVASQPRTVRPVLFRSYAHRL